MATLFQISENCFFNLDQVISIETSAGSLQSTDIPYWRVEFEFHNKTRNFIDFYSEQEFKEFMKRILDT